MVLREQDLLESVQLMRAHNGAVEVAEIMPHMLDAMHEAEERERTFLASHAGELAVSSVA